MSLNPIHIPELNFFLTCFGGSDGRKNGMVLLLRTTYQNPNSAACTPA